MKMNTREKILLYLGAAALIAMVIARVLHYMEAKDMSAFIMFGWITIISAYQQYAKRLQRRNAELEALLGASSPSAA